ncbi:MAG: hypothetical protein IJY62_05180 [Clostridia bacterium]|nr:hypothetical protein [Clostridia bacterium]
MFFLNAVKRFAGIPAGRLAPFMRKPTFFFIGIYYAAGYTRAFQSTEDLEQIDEDCEHE